MGKTLDAPAVRATVGNGAALFVGLVAAYVVLIHSSVASSGILNPRTSDFMEYYSAGRLILAGHGAALYDWNVIGPLQTALVGHVHTVFGILAYLYPPYFVIALSPLAALPYGPARLIWLGINCLLLAGTLAALEHYSRAPHRMGVAFRAGAVASLPVFLALITGQVSLLLLALLVACVLLAERGQDAWSGAVLALAAVKPFYVLPLLMVVLLGRRWRMLAGLAVTVGITGIAAILVCGVRIYASYLRILLEVSSWQGRPIHGPLWYHGQPVAPSTYAPVWNHSFAGFAQLLGISWWVGLALAMSLAALGLVAWITRERGPNDLALAAAVPAGLLISPHTLAYDLCILLIPAAAILRYRAELGQLAPSVLWIGYVAVTAGYLAGFFFRLQLSVVAGCSMLIALAYVVRRVGREQQRPLQALLQGPESSTLTNRSR
jgi:hypothetical protein